MSLLLFDIDGTLLLSGRAGVRAMTRAFQKVFGVRDAFAGLDMAGRTDSFLLSRALDRAALPNTTHAHARFLETYLPLLLEEIVKPGTGRRGLMPGIEALLVALRARPDVHVALLTGNYARAAQIKLDHFGLSQFFAWGVFGEESADRNELGRIAMVRARERGVPAHSRDRAVVIGDTPFDIAAARAAGARAVAVATGSHGRDELAAAGADVALHDFSDTDAIVRMLVGGSAWESNPACPQEGSDRF